MQLLSSVAVILLFPLQITRLWHRMLEIFFGYNKTYEEYLHAQSTTFYARGLAQNVTALSFLGKRRRGEGGRSSLTYRFQAGCASCISAPIPASSVPPHLIGAHCAPTLERYPFFRFSYAGDPYTFQLTFLATLAIWVSRQSDP